MSQVLCVCLTAPTKSAFFWVLFQAFRQVGPRQRVTLSIKMIPISTNLVQDVKSYGPPKIAIFVFPQAYTFMEILTLIFQMFRVFELESSNSV